MTRTVWLASYPKSGNTWFRLLIANLGRDVPADINALPAGGGIASARAWFDDVLLFPSGLLTHDECDALRPHVYRELARLSASDIAPNRPELAIGDTCFIKTHDAYTQTIAGEALLGGIDAAQGVILIVRDPRDVAASFASHRNRSIDDTIDFMADPGSALYGKSDRQHGQLRQQLRGWSGYNESWLDQREVPLHLVRYEDLHADAPGTLRMALAFAGIAVTLQQAQSAARLAAFDVLHAQENERGFREAPTTMASSFFRRGISGAWRDELDGRQLLRIERDHALMMARVGYQSSRGPGKVAQERIAG